MANGKKLQEMLDQFRDQKFRKKTEAQIYGMIKRNHNEIWIENLKKSERSQEWRENTAKRNKENAKDPAFLNKLREGIDKRNSSNEWKESTQKRKKNIRKKYKTDPDFIARSKEWKKKKSPPVSTPYGDWDHLSDAMPTLTKITGKHPATIRNWLASDQEKYKDWIIKKP